MRAVGPEEAKMRANARVGLMGLSDGERDPYQSPWRVRQCDCPCEACQGGSCDDCPISPT